MDSPALFMRGWGRVLRECALSGWTVGGLALTPAAASRAAHLQSHSLNALS